MATETTMTMEDTTVYLDAGFDLEEGSNWHPEVFADEDQPDEVAHEREAEDFTAAYTQAAEHVGEALGISIRVERAETIGGDGETAAWARKVDLWQCLHDCCRWDEDAGEWVYSTAKADKLAARLKRMATEDEE